MRKWVIVVGTVLAIGATGSTPALAQSQPFRGLFAPEKSQQPPETLEFTTTLFGVYDDNLPRFKGTSLRTGPGADVFYSDVRNGLWFTKRGDHTTFSVNGASAFQHYPQIANTVRWSGAGAMGLRTRLEKASFGLSQQVRYSPYSHFRVIPVPAAPSVDVADVAPPDTALAVSARRSYRYNTQADWSYQLSRRSSLSASYGHEYLNYATAEQLDWRTQDANAAFSRSLTGSWSLVAGYAYHRRDFEDPATLPLLRHDINLGVSYSNELPFSPRTTFGFSVGPTIMSRDRTAQGVLTKTNFARIVGSANMSHQLTRTWQLTAAYSHGVQYVEGVPEAFMAHTTTGTIGGYLGRRMDVRFTSGYSTGALRFGTRQRAYDTFANTARMRVAISRNFAFETEYLYYRYVFSDAVTLPTGVPTRDNRHVVRFGLTTWFPLLP